jgi:apolipoprotein N-acyltransferase
LNLVGTADAVRVVVDIKHILNLVCTAGAVLVVVDNRHILNLVGTVGAVLVVVAVYILIVLKLLNLKRLKRLLKLLDSLVLVLALVWHRQLHLHVARVLKGVVLLKLPAQTITRVPL